MAATAASPAPPGGAIADDEGRPSPVKYPKRSRPATATAAKKKKAKGARSSRGGNASAAAAAVQNCFDLLQDDWHVRILGFLGLDDLAEATMVSNQFRDACRHPSLPQERTAVLRIPPTAPPPPLGHLVRFGTALVAMAAVTARDGGGRRKFPKFSRLRIVDPRPAAGWGYYQHLWLPPDDHAEIPEVTALEWSSGEEEHETGPAIDGLVHPHLQGVVGRMLPSLREANVSGAHRVVRSSMLALRELCDRSSATLEKVTCHGSTCLVFLDGFQLDICRNLRELHMDGACLPCIVPGCGPLREDPGQAGSGLDQGRPLAGVLLGEHGRIGTPSVPVSQELLIEFVRSAPNLEWFRSNLTPESVAVLREERPGVVFAS